jgi:ubiquinone biosynthesis protein
MVLLANSRRVVHIVSVLIRHLVGQLFGAVLIHWPRLRFRGNFVDRSGPERLRLLFEDLGGTFIKFGQMLALQPDILSLEYCNELFDLLDRCSPFPYSDLERIFIEETGKSPSEVFDYLDPEPLATASIGQVHVGSLGGRKVAIKVQRPSVETDFAGDIRLMVMAMSLIKRLRLKPIYWMIEPVSEFVGWTNEELDYRCEARYMKQLRRNARSNFRERVPEVFGEFTTRRTLVTEYLEGETVLAYLRATEAGDEMFLGRLTSGAFDADEIARHIIDNFLGDAFQHGVFHADLHPANLMILPDNVVGYVDFGITGVISRYSRQNLIALTLAYTRGDLEGMCEAFFKVSAIDPASDTQGFRNGIKRLADSWYETSGKKRRLRKNFTLVMLDMLKLSRATNIWPERDVIKYIRSSIAIDGLITRFAPGFDVGRQLEVVCNNYLRWQASKTLLTYNTFVGWASSSQQLMRDGPLRAAGFLRRMAAGEIPTGAEKHATREGATHGSYFRMVNLAMFVFVGALMVALTSERATLGINLFTAEILLIGSAVIMLWRTFRRVSEPR